MGGLKVPGSVLLMHTSSLTKDLYCNSIGSVIIFKTLITYKRNKGEQKKIVWVNLSDPPHTHLTLHTEQFCCV